MTRTLWLIAEDESTRAVLAAIFKAKKYDVRIKLRGQAAGRSTLAKEIDKLIRSAQHEKKPEDCIVVINDADLQSELDRQHHDTIEHVCKKHPEVLHIVAQDEIESWLLADAGLCKWLDEKPRNHDEDKKPSVILNSLLKNKKKISWSERYYDTVLKWVDGSGDGANRSPSMKNAFTQLQSLPCLQPEI